MSEAKGTTTLELRLATSGTEAATAKLVGTYKTVEREAARTSAKATRELTAAANAQMRHMSGIGTSMSKLYRSALYGVMSYASVMGARAIFGGISNSIKEVVDRRIDFNQTLAPLLSLGDNSKKVAAMSKEVIGLTLAFGKAGEGTKPIADFLYNLQSGSSGLTPKIFEEIKRSTLLLAKSTGGDLPVAMDLGLKTWHAYGKEVKSTTKLMNMLQLAQDKSYLTFQQMAENFPTIAGTAANLDIPLEEILAAIKVGAKTTGDPSKLFTGLRNLLTEFERNQKKGYNFSGSLTDRFNQLTENGRRKIFEVFDKRDIQVITSIIGRTKELKDSAKEFKSVSDERLLSEEIINNKLKDRNVLFSEQISFLKKIGELSPLENMISRGANGKSFADNAYMRYELGAEIFKSQRPEAFRFMAPLAGIISALDPLLAKKQEESVARYMMDMNTPGGKQWWNSIQYEKAMDAYKEQGDIIEKTTKELEKFRQQVIANLNSPFPYDFLKAMGKDSLYTSEIERAKAEQQALAGNAKKYYEPKSEIYQGAKAWLKDKISLRGVNKTANTILNADWGGIKDFWSDAAGKLISGVQGPRKGKGRIKGPNGEWIEFDPNKKSQGAINTANWLASEAHNRGAANTAKWLAEKEAKKNPGMVGPNGEFIPYKDRDTRRAEEALAAASSSGKYVPLSERGGDWARRLSGKSPEHLANRSQEWAERFAYTRKTPIPTQDKSTPILEKIATILSEILKETRSSKRLQKAGGYGYAVSNMNILPE